MHGIRRISRCAFPSPACQPQAAPVQRGQGVFPAPLFPKRNNGEQQENFLPPPCLSRKRHAKNSLFALLSTILFVSVNTRAGTTTERKGIG